MIILWDETQMVMVLVIAVLIVGELVQVSLNQFVAQRKPAALQLKSSMCMLIN